MKQSPQYPPGGQPPPSYSPYPPQLGQYAPYGGPPPPPKKKSHRTLWIVIGVIVALVVIVGIISNGSNSPQPATSSTPTPAATGSTPTPVPTATPNPLAGARFGGQFTAFTAKYGQPQSTIGGLAFIQNLQVDNNQGRVDNMLAGVPQGQTWTISQGESQCKAFYPADAVHVRDFPTADVDKLNDGVAMVYTSAALTRIFPASLFTDQQHQPISAGTFTVAYNYLFSKSTNQWDSTHLLQCEFDLGIPDTLKEYTKAGVTPTPTSNTQGQITPTHGTPVLRGQISDFYGKYGTPTTINGSDTFWDLNADGSLFLDARNSGGGKVDYLAVSTPDSWSSQKIEDFCMTYAPSDYTVDPTSPPNTYDPIVYDSSGGKFAIHVETGFCSMNTIG